MSTVVIVLLVISAICFGLAAVGVSSKINLVALGLLVWVGTVFITTVT